MASPLSTPHSCTSAACSGYCSPSPTPDPLCCWNDSSSTGGRRRCTNIDRVRCRWCRPRCGWCCTPTYASGTAPLSAEDADAFTEKFGIPVLTSYAATEFGGAVAGWTLADHQKYWSAKRGSVGRASLGAQLRVVDDNGTPLRPDQVGLLEVKPGHGGRVGFGQRRRGGKRWDDSDPGTAHGVQQQPYRRHLEDDIPRGSTGKVDIRQLRDLLTRASEAEVRR